MQLEVLWLPAKARSAYADNVVSVGVYGVALIKHSQTISLKWLFETIRSLCLRTILQEA